MRGKSTCLAIKAGYSDAPMRTLPLVLGLLLVSSLPLATAGDAHALSGFSTEASVEELPNGLKVILKPDFRTPIVAVNVWYHVGSKDEALGRNGFAHLFEHMMFQGSKHVPEDTFFKFLERAGGTGINGTTNTDRTNYFETLPANQLELALWLESDRMGFLLDHVDQATFEGQRNVVKNERRQNYENAPYGMLPLFINEQLFPEGHPYHFSTIGSPKDLDSASLGDVKRFFSKWYVPNNATLVIAGAFQPDEAMRLVKKYFGPIPRGEAILSAANVAPVVRNEETKIVVEAGVELPRVEIDWPTPAFFARGDADLDVLARILSAGKTSRLYKTLVYDLKIAQSVSSHQGSMQYASDFDISATVKPGHTAEEVLGVIDRELEKVRAELVTDAELSRAKIGITSDMLFSIESIARSADHLNMYNHYLGTPNYGHEDRARTERVSKESVQQAARDFLGKGRVVTLVVPTKGAPISGRVKSMNGVAK